MKTENIIIRSTKVFKKRVKKAAGMDNKDMSKYITDLIVEDIKKKEKWTSKT